MGRPRKNIESESFGVRITKPLLSELDEYAKEHSITRSAAAAEGVKLLVNSKECINCGTQNPREGVNCAKCGTPLYEDVEILGAMISILGIVSGKCILSNKTTLKKYQEDGLTPVFTFKIRRGFNIETKYSVEIRFKTQTGILVQPTDKSLMDEEIDKKLIMDSLPTIRKKFEAEPDLKEEIRNKYLNTASDE